MKRVLQLPPQAQLEYKPHRSSMQDRSSFRNTQAWKPKSLADICRLPNGEEKTGWFASMDKELLALYSMDTYTIVAIATATGQEIVPTTWAFRRKCNPDGSFFKYKSRLVEETGS
jgi:hypothetical protein